MPWGALISCRGTKLNCTAGSAPIAEKQQDETPSRLSATCLGRKGLQEETSVTFAAKGQQSCLNPQLSLVIALRTMAGPSCAKGRLTLAQAFVIRRPRTSPMSPVSTGSHARVGNGAVTAS